MDGLRNRGTRDPNARKKCKSDSDHASFAKKAKPSPKHMASTKSLSESAPNEKDDEEIAQAEIENAPNQDNETDDEEIAQAEMLQGLESESEDDGGLPIPAAPAVQSSKELEKARQKTDGSGVVYLGRLPKGFYEHQIRGYFSQFGPILRLRVSRSVKTGNAKHYGFVEFESLEVAKIVAATMDNYLMYGHILKCKMVPAENVHESLWKGANKRFKTVPWNKMEARKLERPLNAAQWKRRIGNEEQRRAKKAEQAKQIGYEFAAPALKKPGTA